MRGTMVHSPFGPQVLDLDCEGEAGRISGWIVDVLAKRLRRRGLVVSISGGVDSAACAALAVRALGAKNVFGLLLPERESSDAALHRGRLVASRLGIDYEVIDITQVLEALNCYRLRDEAIRSVVPAFGEGWKNKLVIAGGIDGGISYFNLVVASPDGTMHEHRLPLHAYLQIVAATNFKQRVRKTLDYFHADRLNYAVIGTPNRLEYDQGFFVKLGDGAADIKPIAHLYKTQVFAMARSLGVPQEVCDAVPTTDTYTLAQGQDEFFFALPYPQMDLALWALDHGVAASVLGQALGSDEAHARRLYKSMDSKRRAARYLHAPAETLMEQGLVTPARSRSLP